MKKLICTLLFIAFVTKAWAQESEVLKLQGEVRADYLRPSLCQGNRCN